VSTFKQVQDEVLQILHGYGLDSPRFTTLAGAVDATVTSFAVKDAANMSQGVAEIDGELVFIETVDKANDLLTVTADGRGWSGTTPAAHLNGARVVMGPVWPRNRVKQAINDTIMSTYPTLFGVGQTSFTYSPAVSTYSLPADCEKVVRVEAATIGPSKAPQVLTRWVSNSVSPTGMWPTTNSLELQEPASPGQLVTVTYMKRPTDLVADSDQFTACGLEASARLAVVYGACAQLLSFMDISRLPVDTARADEYDEKTPVGMASRLSGQLQLRFEMELEKERRRLRARVPVTVTVRKR
jgi:hypothetical protein